MIVSSLECIIQYSFAKQAMLWDSAICNRIGNQNNSSIIVNCSILFFVLILSWDRHWLMRSHICGLCFLSILLEETSSSACLPSKVSHGRSSCRHKFIHTLHAWQIALQDCQTDAANLERWNLSETAWAVSIWEVSRHTSSGHSLLPERSYYPGRGNTLQIWISCKWRLCYAASWYWSIWYSHR